MSYLTQVVPNLPMSRVDPYEKQVAFGTPDSLTSCCGYCNPKSKKFSHEATMKRWEEIIRRRK